MGVTYQFGLFNQPGNMGAYAKNINPVLNKALFKLRLLLEGKEKIINFICLPSPSRSASRSMGHHPFCHAWRKTYGRKVTSNCTEVFRRHIYGLALNRNFTALDALQ